MDFHFNKEEFRDHALVVAQRATQPGEPLPGVSPVEFDEFRLGVQDFLEVGRGSVPLTLSERAANPARSEACSACGIRYIVDRR